MGGGVGGVEEGVLVCSDLWGSVGAGVFLWGMVFGEVGGWEGVWNGQEVWCDGGGQAAGGWGRRGVHIDKSFTRTGRQPLRRIIRLTLLVYVVFVVVLVWFVWAVCTLVHW